MEIRAARYFNGFKTRSQKEQLEFVTDSRKQIEELLGEVKFALKEKGDSIPEEIQIFLGLQMEEVINENLFTRLEGLNKLLSSLTLLEVNEKEISDFVGSNYPYISEYLLKISKVEVSARSATFAERQAVQDQTMVTTSEGIGSIWSPETLEAIGLKPFYAYDEMLVDCINKIAKGGKNGFFSEDLSFREEEKRDSRKWFSRVRKSKDAAKWILSFDMLTSLTQNVHDGRVAEERAKLAAAREASS